MVFARTEAPSITYQLRRISLTPERKENFRLFVHLSISVMLTIALWVKLGSIGITGKLLDAIKSLYVSVASCIRINSLTTDWFDVMCGLRQGCCLSPLLFILSTTLRYVSRRLEKGH